MAKDTRGVFYDPTPNKEEQNRIIQDLLYQSALEREMEWRAEPKNHSDVELFDKMLSEINELGFEFKYQADFFRLLITNTKIIDVILRYLGKFENHGLTEHLVLTIADKRNKFVTKKIIDTFNETHVIVRPKGYHKTAYDNAFKRLQDKRYVNEYLQWLSNPEIATTLPFTMLMLARWKVLEARAWFMKYVDSGSEDSIVFTSIKALACYNNKEARDKIFAMQNSENKDIRECANKVAKKLK